MARAAFALAFRTVRLARPRHAHVFIVSAMVAAGIDETIARAARDARDARGRTDPLILARDRRPHVLIDRFMRTLPGCGGRYACGGHCRDC